MMATRVEQIIEFVAPSAPFALVSLTAVAMIAAFVLLARRRTRRAYGDERYRRRQVVRSELRRFRPTRRVTLRSTDELDAIAISSRDADRELANEPDEYDKNDQELGDVDELDADRRKPALVGVLQGGFPGFNPWDSIVETALQISVWQVFVVVSLIAVGLLLTRYPDRAIELGLRTWWWTRSLSTTVIAIVGFITLVIVAGALHEPATGSRAFAQASAIGTVVGLIVGVATAAIGRLLRSGVQLLWGQTARRRQRPQRGAPRVIIASGKIPHPDGGTLFVTRVNAVTLAHPDPTVLEADVRRVARSLLDEGEIAPTESEHFALRAREGVLDLDRIQSEMHTLVWQRFTERIVDGHEKGELSLERDDVLDDLRDSYPTEYVDLVRRELVATGVIERVGERYRYAAW